MKNICIIPARGGSKRIPRKNIVDFLGKPLIAWTIELALKSKLFDKVFVSTEDLVIAEIAKSFGAEVPFLRPTRLATDNVHAICSVLHFVQELIKTSYTPDLVVELSPVYPLRTIEDVVGAVEMMIKVSNANVLRTVHSTSISEHPYRQFTLSEDGKLSPLLIEKDITELFVMSQVLPKYYCINSVAGIYLKMEDFLMDGYCWGTNFTLGYEVPSEDSIDIDDYHDLDMARILMQK
ncbi:MAG: acylneuraminate cytidylyltransferase family protein, partial [Nitrosopumilus sp.]